MKPDLPRQEWLTPMAYDLHQAERKVGNYIAARKLLRNALSWLLVGLLFLAVLFLMSSCATPLEVDNVQQAATLRARRPFVTPIRDTGSMRDRMQGDREALVTAKFYKDLQRGDWVEWWPAGWSHPVAHILLEKQGGRWTTAGTTGLYLIAYPQPDPQHLTEEKYIGLIELLPQ